MKLVPAMRLILLLLAVLNAVLCLTNLQFIFWQFKPLNLVAAIATACGAAFCLCVRRMMRYV